jgi:hypothetical protein
MNGSLPGGVFEGLCAKLPDSQHRILLLIYLEQMFVTA